MRDVGRRVLLGSLVGLAAVVSACSDDDGSPAESAVVVERLAEELVVRSSSLTASVRLSSYRLAIHSDSVLRTTESDGGGPFYERGGVTHVLTRVGTDRPLADGVELRVDTTEGQPATVVLRFRTPRTLEVTVQPPDPSTVTALGDRFDSPPSEHIYGLTERLRDSPPLNPPTLEIPADDIRPPQAGSLDRRGEIVEMLVRPTIALYAPFFHSSRGYGLAVEGTTVGLFDVAETDPDVLQFRFETGNAPDSRQLRFYVFDGPEHATILDEYTQLVGRPFVPPDWAFLPWRWRGELRVGEPAMLDGVALNADLVEDLQMYEQLGIPPGVYVLDRPVLEGEFGFGRFAWDERRLPNPEAMLAALRSRGFRVLTWSALWACGSGENDNGTEALRLGFLAPFPDPTQPPRCNDAQGSNFILDPTNPEMAAWWEEKLAAFFDRYDLDGIKLDRGEEHIPTAASDIWADGRTGREVRNAYPTLQAKMHHDAMNRIRPDGDFLVMTRSGYTGTPRWAIAWGGDTAGSQAFGAGDSTDLGLRSAIISQQRAAFLGYPMWGSDTGGYYQFKDREVFARWIEFSAFSGIMEIGGTNGPHAPWDMPTEPRHDDELIEIYRRYTTLRTELQPYLVDAAREAATSGLPIVRPLVFAFRDDPEVADRWDQYLLGPELMVAPVWRRGERVREIYFPAGRWENFWDAADVHEGPSMALVEAPLDVIPVYRRKQ